MRDAGAIVKDLLTLTEAAAALGLRSARTLRQQVLRGRLDATLYGHTYLVAPDEVERYRKEHRGRIGRPRGTKDRQPRAPRSRHGPGDRPHGAGVGVPHPRATDQG